MNAVVDQLATSTGAATVSDGDEPSPHHSRTQQRDERGQFANGNGTGEPTADAPTGAEGEDPNAPPVEGAEPEVDPLLRVGLPPRREGEPEVEIIASDPDTAEALRRLKNGYTRGEDARALTEQAHQQMAQVEEFGMMLDIDPIGVITERQYSPEMRANMALALITQPDVLDAIRPILGMLSDEQQLRLVRAEVNTDRLTLKEQATQRVQAQRTVQQNVRQITSALEKLVPDGLNDIQRQIFLNDARNDVSSFANARGLMTLDPMHLPQVLAARLGAYGMDPNAAYARLVQSGGSSTTSPNTGTPRVTPALTGRPSPAAPAGAGSTPAPATGRTAEQIRQASDRRRSVAAVGGPGAGAPALSMPKPPHGSTIKDASRFARERMAGRPA